MRAFNDLLTDIVSRLIDLFSKDIVHDNLLAGDGVYLFGSFIKFFVYFIISNLLVESNNVVLDILKERELLIFLVEIVKASKESASEIIEFIFGALCWKV